MLDMLTADASAKHHDHSLLHLHHHHHHSHPPHDEEGNNNGSFFTQMPLSILGAVLRRQSPAPPAALAAPDPDGQPALLPGFATTTSLMTPAPSTPGVTPGHSRPASVSSRASCDEKPKKRAPKPKTTYNLAQPPPVPGSRHKLHLRPKVLLQLHQVVPSRRPKPVYEVIPFSLLAPRSTRRLARTFNSKERLGPSDLLIVRAEDYGTRDEDEKTDDERWGTREVIGIICPARKNDKDPSDRTEVLMDDGTSWEVTNMANGGYEFSYTDEHGLTLKRRWVVKLPHSRRTSGMSTPGSPGFVPEEKKFKFSTISPHSRRHPVIASLSRASIDVYDTYMMPTAASPPTPGYTSPLPTPASITSLTEMSAFMEKETLPIKTDDALRRFIVLSGIWVAFSENWSPAYSSSKSINCPYPLLTSSGNSRPAPNRTVSMSFLDSPRSVSPASTVEENRRVKSKLFRSGTVKTVNGSSNTNGASSPTSPISTPTTTTSVPSSPVVKNRSRRANSTGNADLGPRASTRKRFPYAFCDETLAETEEERQSKRSMELLRIKTELASNAPVLPSTPVQVLEPPPPVTSPPSPDPRSRKTQSAYNPITTAGLWDSGVVDGPGAKVRPTSMMANGNKKKDKKKDRMNEKGQKRGFRQRFLGIFRREKTW